MATDVSLKLYWWHGGVGELSGGPSLAIDGVGAAPGVVAAAVKLERFEWPNNRLAVSNNNGRTLWLMRNFFLSLHGSSWAVMKFQVLNVYYS